MYDLNKGCVTQGSLLAFSSLSALFNLVEARPLFLRERAGRYYRYVPLNHSTTDYHPWNASNPTILSALTVRAHGSSPEYCSTWSHFESYPLSSSQLCMSWLSFFITHAAKVLNNSAFISVYWMAGLSPHADRFFKFLFILVLYALAMTIFVSDFVPFLLGTA